MAYKNAMNKTGIYQDRENGMLKNHGMLKDLGMMQEEGMRGMRRMRNLHQTGDLKNNPDIKYAGDVADESAQKSQMEGDKGPIPKMEIKPVKSVTTKSKEAAPIKSLYAGEPIDIKYGGKSMRVSGVKPYTKESGSQGYTVNRPGKGAFGIEVPMGTEQYKAIKKSLKSGYAG